MSPLDRFWTSLTALIPLSDEDRAEIENLVSPTRLAAGEVFVEEGEVRRRGAFVCRGAFRYFVRRDGHEHITGFEFEGSFIGDFGSFFEGVPAMNTVAALEHSEVLVYTYEKYKALAGRIPGFERLRSITAEQLLSGTRARAAEMQQYSAEERYRRLLQRSPHVLQRVPLYMVASYLGVTPEALSRIRRRVR